MEGGERDMEGGGNMLMQLGDISDLLVHLKDVNSPYCR